MVDLSSRLSGAPSSSQSGSAVVAYRLHQDLLSGEQAFVIGGKGTNSLPEQRKFQVNLPSINRAAREMQYGRCGEEVFCLDLIDKGFLRGFRLRAEYTEALPGEQQRTRIVGRSAVREGYAIAREYVLGKWTAYQQRRLARTQETEQVHVQHPEFAGAD